MRHLEHSTPTYKSIFGGHIEAICDATTAVCATKLQEAVSELKTFLRTADPELEGASVLDVEVTCNGTWAKRGYTSLCGCVFVVSVDTGKELDLKSGQNVILSLWSTKNGKCIMKQSAQLTFRTHQRLWKLQVQSSCGSDLEKNGLRYTSFVGDGDSASQALQNFFSSASLFKLKCMFPTGHRRHFACT